jgi:hypothetical protein
LTEIARQALDVVSAMSSMNGALLNLWLSLTGDPVTPWPGFERRVFGSFVPVTYAALRHRFMRRPR